MKSILWSISLSFALIAAGVAAGCGHPSTEMVFNTSTDAYPIATDSSSLAVTSVLGGGDGTAGVAATSVVRIPMQALADSKVEALWLNALVLVAKEGDVRFVQLAKCYAQPKGGSKPPVLLGTASASDVSDDGKSMTFHVDSSQELSGLVKSAFEVIVEIEGDNPNGNVSVSADLKLKARIAL